MLGITNVSNAPSIVLTNTSVSSWTALPSTGTDSDMKTQGYTYYASIPCNGISADTIAEVTFSEANAKSGNYASTCRTYADEIRVYSKVNTAITIPSIIVHSIVETYYTMDNAPTSGSTKAVTSGGVYTALAGKVSNTGNQSINGNLTVNKTIIDQLSIDVLSSSNNLYNVYDLDNAYADTRARLVLRVGANGTCELYLEKYVISTGVRTAQQSIISI